MKYTQTSLPKSQIAFAVVIPSETIKKHYKIAIAEAVKNFTMDGFRPGHAPESVVIQKIGTMALWTDALEKAVPDVYLQIITETKVNAIGRPEIAITKMADQGDVELTLTTSVLPDFELPKYLELAKTVYAEKIDNLVTEAELDAQIMDLRKVRFHKESQKDSEKESMDIADIADEMLPEMTDEYAAGYGAGISSVAELRSKLSRTMTHEKIHRNEEKLRGSMMDALAKAVTVELPEVLVQYEVDKMLSQFQHDMSMSGVTLEQYLEHSKKTVEEMRSELYQPAHARAVTQMILDRIAEKENISADTARLDQEMAAMAEQYANAPGYDAESARNYIEQILTNQAVFNWFESKSGFVSHDHDALVAAE